MSAEGGASRFERQRFLRDPEKARRWLETLGKWRAALAGWQLGTRLKGDPEGDAVRDHREATLMLRAEVNALVGLLLELEVFTMETWLAQLGVEAQHLSDAYAAKFPGIVAFEGGLRFDERATDTMKGWLL